VHSDTGNQLLAGRSVRLSQLFQDPEGLKDAARRARALRAKAIENDEERGLQTLHVAFGLATWTSDRSAATPNAPILLYHLDLKPFGVTGEDFHLQISPEPEVNPTLQHLIETDFGIRIDSAALTNGTNGELARPSTIFEAFRYIYAAVPGFEIANRLVVGNFSYAKLPMVRDLERSQLAIEQHALLSGIAGDSEAKAEVRGRQDAAEELNLPVVPPPADEFLVLDADGSQSRVIARVSAGADLAVVGPPGTGKSQTISNLIATLVARGRSVLFVAEKRAAIQAVIDRLEKRGLGDLVLDLHDGAANRRRVAAELSRALASSSAALRPDTARLHRQLERRRAELENYADQLHRPTDPWALSAFEAQNRILEIPQSCHTDIRFRGSTLNKLLPDLIADASGDACRFLDLGGRPLIRQEDPWAPAYSARVALTPGKVEDILEHLHTLRTELLPSLEEEVHRVCSLASIKQPETLRQANILVNLLRDVNEVSESLSNEVFELNLDEIVRSLAPAQASLPSRLLAALFNQDFRRARATLRACSNQKVSIPDTLRLAVLARDCSRDWAHFALAGGSPQSLGDQKLLAGLQEKAEQALNTSRTNSASILVSTQLLWKFMLPSLRSIERDHSS
jgi:hypothetical protein